MTISVSTINGSQINTHMDENQDFLPPGMLSAPQIHYYVQKYKIIDGFQIENLKAAVYEMRLGELAVRWENKKKITIRLSNIEPFYRDTWREKIFSYIVNSYKQTNVLELPPNSLTFITTIERFNLPRDIIARFNLKSKWVHRGLLLGTGPIVDPGFQSRVLIPLHNFSSSSVYIEFNTAIINVEFTKTLNPDQSNIVGLDLKCVNNEHFNTPIEKFLEYAKDSESSVYCAINENKTVLGTLKLRMNVFSILGVIALAALTYAGYQLVQSTNTIYLNTQEKILSTHKELVDISAKLKDENDVLHMKYTKLQEEFNSIKNHLLATEKQLPPTLPNALPSSAECDKPPSQ